MSADPQHDASEAAGAGLVALGEAFRRLCAAVGAPAGLESGIRFEGHEAVIASPHRLAAGAALAIGLQAAGALALWQRRNGETQDVSVHLTDALRAVNSTKYLRQNGIPIGLGRKGMPRQPLMDGFFRTRDGRLMKFNGTLDAHRYGTLRVLGAQNFGDSIAAATARFDAAELEETLAREGLVGAVVRTAGEWRATPHGRGLAPLPPVRIRRVGDGPVLDLPPADRPLHGIRCIELTQILAGPTVGRTLAEHGAAAMRVGHMNRVDPPYMVIDTGFGKRSAFADLDDAGQRAAFMAALAASDVFVRSFRPGGLDARGLSTEAVAALRPGIVQVQVSCYGSGPWQERRGYETIAQAATGVNAGEGSLDAPLNLPTHFLSDFLTGFLGAAGAMLALERRMREGGSWLVEVSLARTIMLVQDLGLFDRAEAAGWPKAMPDGGDGVAAMDSPYGRLDYLSPVPRFARSPARWDTPPVPPGASRLSWA